jgi:hypothetical protein
MQKCLFLVAFSWWVTCSFAQPANYSTANAHSHNDYKQTAPLYSAYYAQFGSIEVDIFLEKEELLVAHTKEDLPQHRTLEDLYLKPLQAFIQNNQGKVYADSSRKMQIMLDIKTDAPSTLNKLIVLLQKYPQITKNKSLRIVVTGNRPDPSTYTTYPSYIWFDGLLSEQYTKEALTRIALLQDNFLNYSKWKGEGNPPAKDWAKVRSVVIRAHGLRKPVRFWNTPDFMDAWEHLTELGVDYINTDSIRSLASFLKSLAKN